MDTHSSNRLPTLSSSHMGDGARVRDGAVVDSSTTDRELILLHLEGRSVRPEHDDTTETNLTSSLDIVCIQLAEYQQGEYDVPSGVIHDMV